MGHFTILLHLLPKELNKRALDECISYLQLPLPPLTPRYLLPVVLKPWGSSEYALEVFIFNYTDFYFLILCVKSSLDPTI